jgi:ABC-type bacteriocin/lantibiotic exporter with double-glycine peptidase domain
MCREIFSEIVMLKYFLYVVHIFNILNIKHRILIVVSFFNSFFLALIETFSIGVLAIYIGFLSNTDLLISKIPIYSIQTYFRNLEYESLVFQVSIFIVVTFIIKNLLIIFSNWFNLKVNQAITSNNSKEMFEFILDAEFSFLINSEKSLLTFKIYNEVKRVGAFIFGYNQVIKEILLVIFLLTSLFLINPNIFLIISIIFFIALTITVFSFKNFLIKIADKIKKHSSLMLGSISEIIDNVSLIKITSKNSFFINKYINQLNIQIKYSNFRRLLLIFPRSIFEILGISIVIFFALFQILGENIKIEDLFHTLSFVSLAAIRLIPAFSSLNTNFSSIIFNEKTFVEFYKNRKQILQNKIERSSVINKNNKTDNLIINLNEVNFSYKKEKLVLDSINYTFEKNKIYGISGKSGSGKSTLIKMIMGLLDPKSGVIFFNGKNIKFIKPELHKLIGYIPQRIFLIDDNLESNIAMGVEKNKIDKNRLKECMDLANLSDLIQSSEMEKFQIAEQGQNLSGGQVQCIGLARALYGDPKILIFDEPTNNIDMYTKNRFIKNLKKIANNKICIIVTHDKELIQNCDKKIIINSQKINEQR